VAGNTRFARAEQLTQNLGGSATTHDLTLDFTFNPAGQIETNTRDNNVYSFAHANGSTTTPADGLNRLTSVNAASIVHDARGNMTSEPVGTDTRSYAYSSENLLTSATVGGATATFGYDPLVRLASTSGGYRFVYDEAASGAGLQALTLEYNSGGGVIRRYVHGPSGDEPLVWYVGSGTTERRFLHADERGSIAAVSKADGTIWNASSYDEYGNPGPWNSWSASKPREPPTPHDLH
jgi:hypothetical protein